MIFHCVYVYLHVCVFFNIVYVSHVYVSFFTLPLISILFDCPWVIILNLELLWLGVSVPFFFLSPASGSHNAPCTCVSLRARSVVPACDR